MNDIVKTWEKVLETIKPDILSVSFQTWIETIIPVEMSVDNLLLEVPYPYCKQMIETRYMDLIKNALLFITGRDYNVDIRVNNASEAVKGKTIIMKQEANIGMHLNPSYTFDTFVTGKSNELANAIAKNIAQCVIENKHSDYNPMFLYGGVGLGKTHLMNAVCHEILQNRIDIKILYTTSEQFTIDLVNAIKVDKNQEFRDKYRTVDVLLIDDIQFIGGKENIQEEFFHTFNALYQENKHIIITSDRHPRELYTLTERLRTRLGCSGIHEIGQPDFETRIAILKKKADNIGIELTDQMYREIAENIKTNIRELEGVIKMVKSFHILMKKEITMQLIDEVIKHYIQTKQKTITLDYITENVEKYFNLKDKELLSSTKAKNVAYPRQIAMYIMREKMNYSLVQIAEFFGRDHSTIIHGINKVKNDIEEDASKKNLVDNILKNIKE